MNILVSTTRDWNLGDEVIWIGVKKLLDKVLPGSNYFFYNRNPDLFSYRKVHGNYLTTVADFIDIIVLAGTPEFFELKMERLYETAGTRTIWAIGIAYGAAHIIPDEKETEIFKKSNFMVIARSEITREIIHKPIEVLPCPSLLCSPPVSKTKKSCFVGNVEYNFTGEKDVICYTIPDFEKAKKLNARYITEAQDLISAVAPYETVYTDRLHGGFAAIATGSSVVFQKKDFRIDSAVETWGNYSGDLEDDYLKILFNWKSLL